MTILVPSLTEDLIYFNYFLAPYLFFPSDYRLNTHSLILLTVLVTLRCQAWENSGNTNGSMTRSLHQSTYKFTYKFSECMLVEKKY